MAKGQRARTKKTSAGVHGGGGKGRPLTGIEKILLSRHHNKQWWAKHRAEIAKVK